ncbi:MAG TPA: hypothetical protein HA257_04860 [Candidatus Methanoperedenaceae archaeon]|nr:hypothetical protein [Candidatus Methanoperedenaceae archaeon]
MHILRGYREYIEKAEDPNLRSSIEKMGCFFIFDSIEAWRNETPEQERDGLPLAQLTLDEYLRNRFIATP